MGISKDARSKYLSVAASGLLVILALAVWVRPAQASFGLPASVWCAVAGWVGWTPAACGDPGADEPPAAAEEEQAPSRPALIETVPGGPPNPAPPVVENTYVSYPTTVIREEALTPFVDLSGLVTDQRLERQADRIFSTIRDLASTLGDRISETAESASISLADVLASLAESFTTALLHVTGNATLDGSLVVGGPTNLATTTASRFHVTGDGDIDGVLAVSGPTFLATTTVAALLVSGDTTVDGVLTADFLSVSGLISLDAISAPYYTATSTTGSSTFAGLMGVAGNVGIGTFDPTTELEIVKDTGTSGTPNPAIIRLHSTSNGGSFSDGAWAKLEFYSDEASYGGSKVHAYIGAHYTTASSPSGNGGVSDLVFALTPNAAPYAPIERMRIDRRGNVGIGTTAANTANNAGLTVEKDQLENFIVSSNYGAGLAGGFVAYSARGTQLVPTATQAADNLGGLYFGGWDTALSHGARIYGVAAAEWGTAGDATDNPTDIRFATAQDGGSTLEDRLAITSAGNVGIGTTGPASLLEIQGGLTTTGSVLALGTKEPSVVANDVLGRINFYAPLEADGADSILAGASIVAVAEGTFTSSVNSSSLQFQTGASEAATTKMTITSAGNVGIGTTAPNYNVDLGITGAILNIGGGSSGSPSLYMRGAEVLSYYPGTGGGRVPNTLVFGAANVVDSTYRIQINGGTGTNGIIARNAGTYNVLRVDGGAVNIDNLGNAQFLGNTGIGTSASSFKLEVAGNVGPSANTAYNLGSTALRWGCVWTSDGSTGTCASDERLKDRIEDLDFGDALTKVAGLRPRTFTFNDDPDQNATLGLIAQEAEEIAPELVVTDPETGLKAVRYGALPWLVMSAVQQLAAKVNGLADIVSGFAVSFTSGRVTAENELCVDDLCITKEDLQDLLDLRGSESRDPVTVTPPEPASPIEPVASDGDIREPDDESPETATDLPTIDAPSVVPADELVPDLVE